MLITRSRFVFITLMKYFPSRCLLLFVAVLGAIYTLTVIYRIGMTDAKVLFLASGCMSLLFSTNYESRMQKLDSDSKIGVSMLMLAILRGTVLISVQGVVSDSYGSINISFYVSLVCFLVLSHYSRMQKNLQHKVTVN